MFNWSWLVLSVEEPCWVFFFFLLRCLIKKGWRKLELLRAHVVSAEGWSFRGCPGLCREGKTFGQALAYLRVISWGSFWGNGKTSEEGLWAEENHGASWFPGRDWDQWELSVLCQEAQPKAGALRGLKLKLSFFVCQFSLASFPQYGGCALLPPLLPRELHALGWSKALRAVRVSQHVLPAPCAERLSQSGFESYSYTFSWQLYLLETQSVLHCEFSQLFPWHDLNVWSEEMSIKLNMHLFQKEISIHNCCSAGGWAEIFFFQSFCCVMKALTSPADLLTIAKLLSHCTPFLVQVWITASLSYFSWCFLVLPAAFAWGTWGELKESWSTSSLMRCSTWWCKSGLILSAMLSVNGGCGGGCTSKPVAGNHVKFSVLTLF